jgi:anti-sigma B factor antagonist
LFYQSVKRGFIMDIHQLKKNEILILTVDGRLDSGASGTLEKTVLAAIEEGEKNLLLDFSKMDYISSAGLRVLLMAAKRTAKMGGKTVLCALNTNVREVFDISGFSGIFSIYSIQEDAMRDF